MPGDGPLLAAVLGDPAVLYPALAALLLASISLATGLVRGDALALARPVPVLWLVALVALTGVLALVASAVPPAWTDVVAGLERFPLYLYALAYGSLPGLVAVAIAVAWLPVALAPWHAPLLVLEVVVVGWLAVWPSPRRWRPAGPVYALGAYALAWGTAGLAVLAHGGDVGPAALAAQHALVPVGILAVAALLALVSPAAYERLFPHSRIAPERSGGDRRRSRGDRRDAATRVLPSVDVPRPLRRRRRGPRALTPLPDDGE